MACEAGWGWERERERERRIYVALFASFVFVTPAHVCTYSLACHRIATHRRKSKEAVASADVSLTCAHRGRASVEGLNSGRSPCHRTPMHRTPTHRKKSNYTLAMNRHFLPFPLIYGRRFKVPNQ